jgi:hypothetical protein
LSKQITTGDGLAICGKTRAQKINQKKEPDTINHSSVSPWETVTAIDTDRLIKSVWGLYRTFRDTSQ